jgi:hypothetical protein
MAQFHLVVLGALFARWKILISSIEDCLSAVTALWNAINNERIISNATSFYHWFHTAATVAEEALTSDGDERETRRLLLNYGYRRGRKLLGTSDDFDAPFFGLCNPHTITELRYGRRFFGLTYLRSMAAGMGLLPHEAVIAYSEEFGGKSYTILATAVPHRQCSNKRQNDGTLKVNDIHARWVVEIAKSETQLRPPLQTEQLAARQRSAPPGTCQQINE